MVRVKRSNKGLKLELFDFDTKERLEEFQSITIAEKVLKRADLKKFVLRREMFLDGRTNKFVFLKEMMV